MPNRTEAAAGESRPYECHRETTSTAPVLDSTRPIREDVKKKFFSLPSRERRVR